MKKIPRTADFESSWETVTHLRGGRHRVRNFWNTPLFNRIYQHYSRSRVGQLSKQISDTSHQKWCEFADHIAYKLTLFRVRRRLLLLFVTFGAASFGYFAAGYGTNWFTMGFRQGLYQPDDFSRGVLRGFASNDKKKYLLQHSRQMNQAILERKGDLDVLEWLCLAKHYAKNGEEETAFQCYYMAHLMDHERVHTNSKLQFDTLINDDVK